MSDGMTDESRRDRQIKSRLDLLNESLQNPIKSGPFFGGLKIDHKQQRIYELEKRVSDLETIKNTFRCCCKFDEDEETILELCLAHRKYFDNILNLKIWPEVKPELDGEYLTYKKLDNGEYVIELSEYNVSSEYWFTGEVPNYWSKVHVPLD